MLEGNRAVTNPSGRRETVVGISHIPSQAQQTAKETAMTMTEYLRSQRTTTQEDVDKVTRKHDVDDFKPSERLARIIPVRSK